MKGVLIRTSASRLQVHINTLPETKYTWHDFTKRVNPPHPERVVERFAPFLRGGKATKIDLHYKV